MTDTAKFAIFRRAQRVWAVASIHADAGRLAKVHHALAEKFEVGDRLAYLGNVIGHGTQPLETVEQLLAFRRTVIATRDVLVTDVAVLRGAQEEMWQKLLQLHFALSPSEVLEWMLDQGIAPTLAAYGGDPAEGFRAARSGATALSRWTDSLRAAMHEIPGHRQLMASLRRAAYTEDPAGGPRLLLVNAGLDFSRPLEAQSDSFWWATKDFDQLSQHYSDYTKVVRGYDPRHAGIVAGDYAITLDGGSGFDGPLIAACLTPSGEILDVIEG